MFFMKMQILFCNFMNNINKINILKLYNKRFKDNSLPNYRKLGWGSKNHKI